MTTTKELTTDSTGSPFGGYVVGTELSAEIRALIGEYGVARQEFTAVQLSKNSYKANDLATDLTVAWITEGSDMLSTQVVLGQKTLELQKLYAIICATRELLEDQEIDLFAFIATRVAEGMAKKEDSAFFTGTGASDTTNGEFEGLLNNADCNQATMPSGKDTFAEITANDLLTMQDESPQSVAKNGKYYMHRSIRNLIRGLKSSETGQYIYQPPTDNAPATIWGRPVVEVEVMPTTGDSDVSTPFVIYGDLKKTAILGYKGTMAIDRFNAGTIRNVANGADINLITSDREAVRFVERVGFIAILPKACTVLSTSAS
jgi:HK97 family phage major capsid protein